MVTQSHRYYLLINRYYSMITCLLLTLPVTNASCSDQPNSMTAQPARLVTTNIADPATTQKADVVATSNKQQVTTTQASRELTEAERSKVIVLIHAMDSQNSDKAKHAYHELLRIVQLPINEQGRHTISKYMAAQLSQNHTIETRRNLCRLLSHIGRGECVDALYKMFMDKDVREMVRLALIRIPSSRATQALVAGLQITDGEFRIALLNAIGEKGDKRAVPALRTGAGSDNEAIRRASVDALAHMPDRTAMLIILHAVAQKKPGATRALLTLGATLADEDMFDEARIAFRTAAEIQTLSAVECCQVLYGFGRVGEAEDVAVVLTLLGDRDKWQADYLRVRAAGLQALARIIHQSHASTALGSIGLLNKGVQGCLRGPQSPALYPQAFTAFHDEAGE